MDCGVYKITNMANGKFYIGSSKNLAERKRQHFNQLRNGTHINKHLQHAFDKYGERNFKFEVLEYVIDSRALLQREQFYIDSLDACNSSVGYNLSEKATNCVMTGEKHWAYGKPPESFAWYGKHHTEDEKRRIGKSQKGLLNHMYGKQSPMRGKHLSDETKEKLSNALKGKPSYWKGKKLPKETVEKIRKAAIGRPVSDKVIHKSAEWIQHMSDGRKGKYMGADNPNAICLVQLNLDGTYVNAFDSGADASRATGINRCSITNNLKGRNKSAGGYKWVYAADYYAQNVG
jgi:hypothetical protein